MAKSMGAAFAGGPELIKSVSSFFYNLLFS